MNKMPKKVINDYIFYKIVCLDNSVELCYVGSTADFNKRNYSHKSVCNNENNKNYNNNIYKTIRDNGGWGNFKMIQIGTREQLTKRQAEQIEEEYREELKANMNSIRCFLTEEKKQQENKQRCKEYYHDNKEILAEKQKEYREDNKEIIAEKKKIYYENNIDKILKQKKEYNIKNNKEITEQKREKYHKNKEEINERKKEKVTCDCGCIIRKNDLARHKKTTKHLELIENL